MRYLSFLFILTITAQISATNKVDSLLNELDEILLQGATYMLQKEDRINRLKKQRILEINPDKQFEIGYTIIDEYKSYNCDSALTYIDLNMQLAEQEKNNVWIIRTKLQYSFVLSSSGLFVESLDNLNSISREDLPEECRVDYYQRWGQLYINLNTYADDPRFEDVYKKEIRLSYDSTLYYLPKRSPLIYFYQHNLAALNGDYEAAENYLHTYLSTLDPGTHEYAMKSYSLSSLYKIVGKNDLHIEYLILAVMSDVKDAVKENKALLDLSRWLYEHNDIKRAYNYIQYALNDANFYNARFRYFQLSKELPIITDTYQQHTNNQSQRLKLLLTVISILFIILLVTILFLQKQKEMLTSTRRNLDENFRHLEEMNLKLNRLNKELSESDRIKEEYIGYFLDLYSVYIDKLDDYKKMIHTKIATKRFDELLKLTSSNTNKNDNVKELNTNFDKAFLRIYPGFVESFNRLLKEEEQFEIKKEELNTELRVFALIRLGINDSNKIASFLRCSVQTVYNYRSKIKRKAINENEEIEEKIKFIGSSNVNF